MSHLETTVFLGPESPGDGAACNDLAVSADIINGRYRPLRELGAGGIGSVLLVEDLLHDHQLVALKKLQAGAVDRKRIRTLQNEFLVLSLLRHPGLARVFDFGRDLNTSGFFFTTEFVDGVTMLEACQGFDFAQEAYLHKFLDLFVQVLRALEFVHSRELVHGDIKPANILVTANDHSGKPHEWESPQVKLIDFGLVRQEKEFGGRNVMGTLQYIAPEVISGSQIDRRTDLYSVGTVIYCLLTGKFPFQGKAELEILKAHLEANPVEPIELVPSLPRSVNDIIMRLLNKVPAKRYQSAAEVIEAIDAVCPIDLPIETRETSSSYVRYPRIDAHDKFVNALSKACISTWKVKPSSGEAAGSEVTHFNRERVQALSSIDASTHSLGRRVILHGELGAGKKVIIASFKGLIQTRGGAFLTTQGTGDGGKALDETSADDFNALLRQFVAVEQAVSSATHSLSVADSLLKSDIVSISRPGTPELEKALKKFVRYLLFLSLDQPMVIHVDRLEKASPYLAELLRFVVEVQLANEVPQNQLTISATICDDDLDPDCPAAIMMGRPELQKAFSHIYLDRLDRRGVAQVLEFMFPAHDFPDSFISRVAASSDGNPKVIGEICQYLLDRSRIRRTVDGWSLIADTRRDWIPGQVRKGLKATILGLPSSALKLAIAYSYLGNDTELSLAAKFARIPSDQLFGTTAALMNHRILRLVPGSEPPRFVFQYSSAQDILYDLVPSEERPGFHERAGRLTEIETPKLEDRDAKSLSRHFLRAGLLKEAFQYGIVAVRDYTREFRVDKALETYIKIFKLAHKQGTPLRARRRYDLARFFLRVGRFGDARNLLLSIHDDLQFAADPQLLARACVDLATVDHTIGELKKAEEWIERALLVTDTDGSRECSSERASALHVKARIRFLQGQYDESSRLCKESRVISEKAGARETLARTHLLLAENCFALGQRSAAVSACLKALRLFDRSKEAASREEALYCLGKLYKFQDRFSQARMEFLFCAELRGKMGAQDAEAEALVELGGLDLFLGKVREATCAFRRATKLYEVTGNRVALLKAVNLQAESLRITGNFEEANQVVDRAISLSKELGNPLGESEALLVLGKMVLDAGQLERAENLLAKAYPTPPTEPRAQLKCLDFQCRLFHNRGDFERLLKHSTRGVEIAQEVGLPVHEAHFLEHKGMVHLRLGNIEEARTDAASLSEAARKYYLPLSMGRAILVDALVANAEGKRGVASHYFNRAKKIFLEVSSERDLVRHYAHFGQFLMQEGQFAEAFWLYEEALYLSKKLKLDYWRCLCLYSCGVLTKASPDGSKADAKNLFLRAEKLASRAPYGDLLWKARQNLAGM